MQEIKIETEIIKLDAFMKWAAIVSSGAEAKMMIQEELVLVNGDVEIRRGKKLSKGDIVQFEDVEYKIV
ncbi:MAG: S4 domain-containing protein YaaA [Clostridium sp.]